MDTPKGAYAMTDPDYVLVPRQWAERAFGLEDISVRTENLRRKLVAILSADVVGYCRLMNENEDATVSTLHSYRQVMRGHIKGFRGRVIDFVGDNLLAEFPSVVDAVQCAVAMQRHFKQLNRNIPEQRRMEFRIGINIGDVIDQGNSIYGDGVNIAARLQGIAEPGGICISRTAYEQIDDKLPLYCEYIGEREVKNIPKSVQAYRVELEHKIIQPMNVKRKRMGFLKEGKKPSKSPSCKLLAVISHLFLKIPQVMESK